jgi:hypothetical protein
MARAKPTPKTHHFAVRSHSLSPDAEQTLERLRQDASDALGWTVGKSAVVRALIRYAAQQSPEWAAATLHPLIAHEFDTGVVWGGKKK